MDEAQHQKYLQIHKLLTVWAIAQQYLCMLLKRSKTTRAIPNANQIIHIF